MYFVLPINGFSIRDREIYQGSWYIGLRDLKVFLSLVSQEKDRREEKMQYTDVKFDIQGKIGIIKVCELFIYESAPIHLNPFHSNQSKREE